MEGIIESGYETSVTGYILLLKTRLVYHISIIHPYSREMTAKVFDPARVKALIEKSRAANGGKQKVYGFEQRTARPGAKASKCEFFKVYFEDEGKKLGAIVRVGDETGYVKVFAAKGGPGKPEDKADDYDKSTYVMITEGVQDPEQAEEDDENKSITFVTTIEDSGDLGKLLTEMDVEFNLTMREWRKPETEGGLGLIAESELKINDVLAKRYGPKTKAVDRETGKSKKGTPYKVPKFRMKVDFSRHGDDHIIKALRGKQKTEIYDFRTMYIEKGMPQYKLATVDGEPLSELNVHKFLRRGSRIVGGRLGMDYGTISNLGVSHGRMCARLIVDNKFAFTDGEDKTSEVTDSELIAQLAKSQLANPNANLSSTEVRSLATTAYGSATSAGSSTTAAGATGTTVVAAAPATVVTPPAAVQQPPAPAGGIDDILNSIGK